MDREQVVRACCGASVPSGVSRGEFSPSRFAKERKLRIWRDYVAPTANLDQKDKQFVAKVSWGMGVGWGLRLCQRSSVGAG